MTEFGIFYFCICRNVEEAPKAYKKRRMVLRSSPSKSEDGVSRLLLPPVEKMKSRGERDERGRKERSVLENVHDILVIRVEI